MLFENENFNDYITLLSLNNLNPKDIVSETPKTNTYSISIALNKGNLFKDLYKPYKNYEVKKLRPSNEKEILLLKLYEYDFAINDLNLYLDIHPKDEINYKLFKKYLEEYDYCKKLFTEKYGPIELCDTLGSNYNWIENPWSWDRGGITYV